MQRRDFLKRSLAAAAVSGLMPAAFGAATTPSRKLNLHRLTGRVVTPGDTDYDAATKGFNSRFTTSPAAVVFCRWPRDVVHAVQSAQENQVPLRARCGRHSYEGYSSVNGGIVADVSPMQHIHIDRDHRTARVGAGVALLELYEALWEHRLTIPGGSCPTVGIAGLTLGGGYGLLSRESGLTCDQLINAEMVTADGRLRHVDSYHDSDLFWACCGGGGGNFGIVTEFTFRLRPIHQVSIYNVTWDFSDLATVLDKWQHWATTTDRRLTSVLKLRAQSYGTIGSTGQFAGPLDELAHLLKPLSTVGSPRRISAETVDYIDAVHIFGGLRPDYGHWRLDWNQEHLDFKNASDFADRLMTAEAIHTLTHYLETAPGDSSLIQLEAYGGAISDRAPTATAFPHRGKFLIGAQYQTYWNPSSSGEINQQWIANFRQDMQPYMSGGAYCNYIDSQLKNWPDAYYGVNVKRLEQIKARYDPNNFFHFPQSIPMPGSAN